MHLQGRGGVDPSRLVQLEQQLQNSEERRKEEEKSAPSLRESTDILRIN